MGIQQVSPSEQGSNIHCHAVIAGNEFGEQDVDPIRETTPRDIFHGTFAASTAQVNPEAIIGGPNTGPHEFVSSTPVPVHRRVIERSRGEKRIAMIEFKWHANREQQSMVFAGRESAAKDRICGRRSVVASACAVLKIQQRQVGLLPLFVGLQNEVDCDAIVPDSPHRGYEEPQVA